ncbi:MAG: SDR family oxidoreductase, partial [Candidatus Binatia bacterium]
HSRDGRRWNEDVRQGEGSMTTTVITGSSTGIGYATALRLAAGGHSVVATMRNPDSSDLGSVAKDRNLDVDVRPLDVNDGAAVDELFAEVRASRGAIDVLVNNAGLGVPANGSGGAVEEIEMEAFRELMDTNFFGALRCTKAVLPSMRERASGCIVNVSSQAGRLAMPIMSAYCASKWALEAVSESLATEVAPFGIRVALVEPGMILTPIWSKVDMTPPTGPYAPMRMRLGRTVLQEMASGSPPEEVADCIAQAISTDEPRLRWLVGQGATRNIANRRAMTDEEFAALWNGPDEEFFARMFAEPGS